MARKLQWCHRSIVLIHTAYGENVSFTNSGTYVTADTFKFCPTSQRLQHAWKFGVADLYSRYNCYGSQNTFTKESKTKKHFRNELHVQRGLLVSEFDTLTIGPLYRAKLET